MTWSSSVGIQWIQIAITPRQVNNRLLNHKTVKEYLNNISTCIWRRMLRAQKLSLHGAHCSTPRVFHLADHDENTSCHMLLKYDEDVPLNCALLIWESVFLEVQNRNLFCLKQRFTMHFRCDVWYFCSLKDPLPCAWFLYLSQSCSDPCVFYTVWKTTILLLFIQGWGFGDFVIYRNLHLTGVICPITTCDFNKNH